MRLKIMHKNSVFRINKNKAEYLKFVYGISCSFCEKKVLN